MELLPNFELGWLNGWIPLAFLALTDGIIFLTFYKQVFRHLLDQSGWSNVQVKFMVIGKLFALMCLLSLFFSPLKINSAVFPIGIFFILIGLIELTISLFNFRHTPPNKLATKDFYKISRHPQIISSNLVILEACFAVDSWSALLILLFARIFGQFCVLTEEAVCSEVYGHEYHAYMQEIPRYFVFL